MISYRRFPGISMNNCPIKKAEEVVEEEMQEKDGRLEFNTVVASRLYSINGAYQEPKIYTGTGECTCKFS
jgi:hypothetical protein